MWEEKIPRMSGCSVRDRMKSWEFFDDLLDKAHVVGTPGSGFGKNGEGFFRLTAFGTKANTAEAMERIRMVYGR